MSAAATSPERHDETGALRVRDAVRRAVAAQLAAAVYLQVIEWVPLFPWNDLSHGNGQEGLDVILGVVTLLLAVGTARRTTIAMAIAIVGYAAWLALQLETWWVPYVAGASPGWQRIYSAWFGRTFKFLPSIKDHPVPDASHVVLQLLLIAAIVLTTQAVICIFQRRGRG